MMQEIRDRVLRHVGEDRCPPLHGGQQRAGNRLRQVLQVILLQLLTYSVGDPDPQDPHVFGPPGSGSISRRYGSGSFSFLIKVLGGLI